MFPLNGEKFPTPAGNVTPLVQPVD